MPCLRPRKEAFWSSFFSRPFPTLTRTGMSRLQKGALVGVWGWESADSLPVRWLLFSLTDVTVNRPASIIISVSQCTGTRWAPVRLPFGLGSPCLPADVRRAHTPARGEEVGEGGFCWVVSLERTAAIRHSSRRHGPLCRNKASVPVGRPSDCGSAAVSRDESYPPVPSRHSELPPHPPKNLLALGRAAGWGGEVRTPP